jgi:hypothetical protein
MSEKQLADMAPEQMVDWFVKSATRNSEYRFPEPRNEKDEREIEELRKIISEGAFKNLDATLDRSRTTSGSSSAPSSDASRIAEIKANLTKRLGDK